MTAKSRWSGWPLRRRGADDASGEDGTGREGPRGRTRADLLREDLLLRSAAAGLPMAPAAHPSGVSGYRCSCDRVGCPTPGRHPVSFARQTQASADTETVRAWLRAQPLANFITATGATHDVLDVPAAPGRAALDRLTAQGAELGPVASYGDDRLLFFTATRGTPADEDEWWPCELDCHPGTLADNPGLRWHCRGSYVLLPPSRLPSGDTVAWLDGHGPERPLPDPLPVLEALTDAASGYAYEPSTDSAWLS